MKALTRLASGETTGGRALQPAPPERPPQDWRGGDQAQAAIRSSPVAAPTARRTGLTASPPPSSPVQLAIAQARAAQQAYERRIDVQLELT